MNKRRAILLSTIAIISLVVITVGVTVAFFNYSKQGSTENVIKSGGITFYYDEVDKNGNGINLVDALPMTDSEGKAQTNGFNFKVEGVGTENISIPYEITLRKKLGSDDIDNIVKVYLAKTTASNAAVNTEEEVITSLYSSLEDTTHNGYSEKVLYNGLVPATTNSYTQNYRLKMWIDNDTDLSTGEYNDKHFTVMVNVYSNGRVLTEESKLANISSVGVNNQVLTSTEVNGVDTYEIALPEGTTSATINVETENPYSQVTITKTQSDFITPIAMSNTEKVAVAKTVSLTDGNNYFKIVTTSEDNKVEKVTHAVIKVKKLPKLFGHHVDVVDNEPTLTNASSRCVYNSSTKKYNCTEIDISGLYELDVINGFGGADGTTYYFRGNVENNYVVFGKWISDKYHGINRYNEYSEFDSISECQSASYSNCTILHNAGDDMIWRVVRINEDGSIRLILDDYVLTGHFINSAGNNSAYYMYYSGGSNVGNTNYPNVKYALNKWYNDNINSNENYASKVADGSYFCEALKTKSGNTIRDISNVPAYNEYTPDLRCEIDENGHGLLDSTYKIGMITYDELVMAGASKDQYNENYYLYKEKLPYWLTMSPAGVYKNTNNSSSVSIWYVNSTTIQSKYVMGQGASGIRPVINLKATTTATKEVRDGKTYYVVD